MLSRPLHGGNLAWAAAIAGCPAASILDFSASINPLGPPSGVLRAIEDNWTALVKTYPDPNYGSLRQVLAHGHGLMPEWILPGNGAAELLTWAARDLARLEDVVLLVPAFSDYRRSLAAFGAKVNCYAIEFGGEQCMSLALPKKALSGAGLLLNNPHNPSGKLWRLGEIEACLERFALVVVDEAFMDFLPPSKQESLVGAVEDYPNLVIVRSLTKFYSLPGLRLGYAIAHPERLRRWQQWRDPWAVNSLAAIAGEVCLADKEFQYRTWEWLPPQREELYQGLRGIEGLEPTASAANFLLVKTEMSSCELQMRLLQHHRQLIRDCSSFRELGEGYIRVAVRQREENQRLLAALTIEMRG